MLPSSTGSHNNPRKRLNIFYQPLIPDGVLQLDEEESRHCIKVLRKRKGDEIRIIDGRGNFYDAVIASDTTPCKFEIKQKYPEPSRLYKVTVAISPTKNSDRIEWFVEKAVELGIDAIILMECKNTERSHIKTDRLKKVAVSAMKQSIKAWLPDISGLSSFKDVINSSKGSDGFIAFVDPSNPAHLKDAVKPNTDCIVLIGPEGDFTSEELSFALSNGFRKVSLGKSRLRTETAGLAACHIINLVNS